MVLTLVHTPNFPLKLELISPGRGFMFGFAALNTHIQRFLADATQALCTRSKAGTFVWFYPNLADISSFFPRTILPQTFVLVSAA
jgi:hypothetical protein